MRAPLTIAARIVSCCATALVLVGCGAGQINQTENEVPAVNGAFGNAGKAIALRDVLIPYPHDQQGTYPAGSAVPILLTIINQADSADELIAVTSPAASQAVVLGTTQIQPGTTVISTAGGLSPRGEPTSPLVGGELRVVLFTTKPLHAGRNTPVTFQFRNAGTVTLSVPMAAPPNSTGEG